MLRKKIILTPNQTYWQYGKEVWQYRELFLTLALKDLKVRYKQTLAGVLWAVIRPLLTACIMAFIFGHVLKLSSGTSNSSYFLQVYVAILSWSLFSNGVTESCQSVTGNTNLITKIYFPRIIIPLSTIVTCLVDFAISLIVCLAYAYISNYSLSSKLLLFPLVLVWCLFLTCGFGLILSALNVYYRDFRYIIPFILQVLTFISPIGFTQKVIPEAYQQVYALNPLVGIIEATRWCFFDDYNISSFANFQYSIALSLVVFIVGVLFFRKREMAFADVI